jgi:hypothetical protein
LIARGYALEHFLESGELLHPAQELRATPREIKNQTREEENE